MFNFKVFSTQDLSFLICFVPEFEIMANNGTAASKEQMLPLYPLIDRTCHGQPPTALALVELALDLSDPKVT